MLAFAGATAQAALPAASSERPNGPEKSVHFTGPLGTSMLTAGMALTPAEALALPLRARLGSLNSDAAAEADVCGGGAPSLVVTTSSSQAATAPVDTSPKRSAVRSPAGSLLAER